MSKEFKIGLITIVAGALLYYGFNYLRGSDLLSPTNRYYVAYPNVAGLTVSNPVYFNGLPVGRVSGFQLQQSKNRIVVSLDVDKDFRISTDAVAQLANDGLLGSKAIILIFKEATVALEAGDTLMAETDGGIFERFDPAIDNINTTIASLNDLLAQLNETDIKGTVESLKNTLDILGAKAAEVDVKEPLDNISDLTMSLNERTKQLKGLLDNSNRLIDSLSNVPLSATLRKVNTSLDEVNKLLMAVQSEEGTVGKMLSNDSVYNSLNKLLVDLDKLAIHFNEYPKDFMAPLGRKKKKLKGVPQEE